MFRSLTIVRPCACLALAALCAGAFGAAPPRTLPHRELASGTLTELLPSTMFFSGDGVATHFGRYQISGQHDFDTTTGLITDGQFMTTASDGSTITGSHEGTFEILPSGAVAFQIHVRWEQGTGRLAGVTGEGDVEAVLSGVEPGAQFVYSTIGALTFP